MRRLLELARGVFLSLLEVLLPEKERAARIRKRTLSDFTLAPTQHALLGEHITTLVDYKETAVSDLIRALKYEHSGRAALLAAEVLADFLREEIAGITSFSARQVVLVAIPLHPSRERERGFNQVQKILSKLPQEFQDGTLCRISEGILTRTRATPQQARLSRAQRLENVADAFAVENEDLRGRHFILIDDVTTTGATLASAAKPLKKAGAVVTLIALARA
jgi:ComF family protein